MLMLLPPLGRDTGAEGVVLTRGEEAGGEIWRVVGALVGKEGAWRGTSNLGAGVGWDTGCRITGVGAGAVRCVLVEGTFCRTVGVGVGAGVARWVLVEGTFCRTVGAGAGVVRWVLVEGMFCRTVGVGVGAGVVRWVLVEGTFCRTVGVGVGAGVVRCPLVVGAV